MQAIPKSHQDLLQDDAKALAYLATLMNDGSPQLTPLWFNFKDGYFFINSAKGRVKDRNMRARPTVALVIQDPKIPTRYIQVRGRVIEITEQNALEHIDALSHKYYNKPWTKKPDQTRVIYKIQPDKVFVDN